MREPWREDLERLRELALQDLSFWRFVVVPLSAFATVLFFIALERTGNSMPTTLAFMAASSLSLWAVALHYETERWKDE